MRRVTQATHKAPMAGLALAAWVVLAGLVALPNGVRAEPVTITFLHTNDVYEIGPIGGQGGFGQYMTLLKAERARSPNTITTFGGDLLSPSILSGMTKGAQMVALMGDIGTDIAVLGNHEFDFGPGLLEERLKGSRFPWLGGNVLGTDGKPLPGLAATRMVDIAGYKIGFLGVLTPDTDELSSPGPDVTIAPPIETARVLATRLREQGADLVVALTHLDLAVDRSLLRDVKGIDIVLGGHDHDPITFYEGGKLIVKAGYDLHYLAAVDIRLDRVKKKDKEVVTWLPVDWRFVSTAAVVPDPEIDAIVQRYNAELDKELAIVVGTTATALDSRRDTVRTRESDMGDLIADATRLSVGADVGLVNGGGIRADRTYDAGATLTRREILTELPFGNVVVLVELSGSDLLAALENGVSQWADKAGRFLQVSGLTYRFDVKNPVGSRILEATVGGAPLDPAQTYKVATNNFVLEGGDGFVSLANGKVLIDASGGKLAATVVMDYIAAKGEVSPKVDGRILQVE